VKVNRSNNRLYVLEAEIAAPVCLAMRVSESAWLWHARFGRLNFPALRNLTRDDMVHGLPEVEQVDQICGGCLAGKHRRSSFPHRAEYRADEVLELVHGDLCGPITPPTPSGNRYFLLVDDNNRYMWLRTLRSKDQAAVAIKQFQQAVEAETGRKLRVFWSDRSGEFSSVEFGEYCIEQGVRRQLTAPYSPQQNGVVERRNQTVVGTARCLLKFKGLSGWFWGEAVVTAVYLLNRSPTRSLEGRTSFEA
jgi:transposase InsO family protein